MRKTLLELTQSILSDLDSEPVNSLSDSDEAMQIASVIQDTFYNIIIARHVPEHDRLLKLTSLADSSKPSHFKYPTSVKEVRLFEYNGKEVHWKDPVKFLTDMPHSSPTNTVAVLDPLSGTTLIVSNNKDPRFYTSFDDKYIVCDSYDSSVDSVLQESKTRCWGTVTPSFSMTDSFVPDIDDTLFPLLLAEAKSVCFSLFKSGSDPKVEQSARRLKAFVQNDKYRTRRDNVRNLYGRRTT